MQNMFLSVIKYITGFAILSIITPASKLFEDFIWDLVCISLSTVSVLSLLGITEIPYPYIATVIQF